MSLPTSPDPDDIFIRWTKQVGKYFDYLLYDGDIPETKFGRVCQQPDEYYYGDPMPPYDPDSVYWSDEDEDNYDQYLTNYQLTNYNQFEWLACYECGMNTDY